MDLYIISFDIILLTCRIVRNDYKDGFLYAIHIHTYDIISFDYQIYKGFHLIYLSSTAKYVLVIYAKPAENGTQKSQRVKVNRKSKYNIL